MVREDGTDADNSEVLEVVLEVLRAIIAHEGEVPGAARKECGNYLNLDLQCAKNECRAYLEKLASRKVTFAYPD